MDSDQAHGILLGLACGDALGRPVEFETADEIAAAYGRLETMEGYGTWDKPAGTVTDDTQLALRVARSLVAQGGLDPDDLVERFVDWYESEPFDIGRTTMRSLSRLKHGEPWAEAAHEVWRQLPEGQNAGNGSVMRCPPLAIPYAGRPERLVAVSHQSSVLTHADPRCAYGCAVLNLTLAGLLDGRERPLRRALETVRGEAPEELLEALRPVAGEERPATLASSGHVVDTLQTALYDGLEAGSAREAVVTAVNRGGDADTVGAVAGAVAGARFGASELPAGWLAAIEATEELETLATRLQALR